MRVLFFFEPFGADEPPKPTFDAGEETDATGVVCAGSAGVVEVGEKLLALPVLLTLGVTGVVEADGVVISLLGVELGVVVVFSII